MYATSLGISPQASRKLPFAGSGALSDAGGTDYSFQAIIVTVALSYADVTNNLRELTKDNSDSWIQKLWICYKGTFPPVTGRAYCAVGAWTVIDESARIAGCSNKLPKDSGSFGSSKGLYEAARNAGFKIDYTPTPGAIFYRQSDNGSNDHMGIVIEFDINNPNGEILKTVEFNASNDVNKSVEGCIVRSYTSAQYQSYGSKQTKAGTYGWLYIHTETMCSGANLCGVKQTQCLTVPVLFQPCSKPPDEKVIANCNTSVEPPPFIWKKGSDPNDIAIKVKVQWYKVGADHVVDVANNGYSADKCWFYPLNPVAYNNPCKTVVCPPGYAKNPDVEDTKTCCLPEQQAKVCPPSVKFVSTCKDGAIRLYNSEKPMHFDQLYKNPDLFKKWFREDVFKGSKVKPFEYSINPDDPKNNIFPILTDRNGNVFIVTAAQTALDQFIQDNNLFGKPDRVVKYFIDIEYAPRDLIYGGGAVARFMEQQGKNFDTSDPLRGAKYDSAAQKLFSPPNNGGYTVPLSGDLNPVSQFQMYNSKEMWDKFSYFIKGNFYESMLAIEQSNTKYTDSTGNPYVFWYRVHGDVYKESQFAKYLESAFTMIFSAAANLVVPGVGGTLIGAAMNQAMSYARTGQLDVNQVFSLVGTTLSSGVLGLGDDITKYLQKANNVASRVFDPKTRNKAMTFALATADQFQSDILEAIPVGVKDSINSIELFAKNQWAEVEKWTKVAGADIAKFAQSYSNFNLMSYTNKVLGVTNGSEVAQQLSSLLTVFQQIDSDQNIFGAPKFREFFLTHANGNASGLIPNANSMVKLILGSDAVGGREVIGDATDLWAMASLALGMNAPDKAYQNFQLQSLLYKAEDTVRDKMKWGLPAALGLNPDKEVKDRAECIQREINICVMKDGYCRSPKVMFNGSCIDPPTGEIGIKLKGDGGGGFDFNTTTQPGGGGVYWKTNLINNPPGGGTTTTQPGGGTPFTPPPTKITLPACIKEFGSGYVYCPDTKCDSALWKKLNIAQPNTSVPKAGTTQANTTKAIDFIAATPVPGTEISPVNQSPGYSPNKNFDPISPYSPRATFEASPVSPKQTNNTNNNGYFVDPNNGFVATHNADQSELPPMSAPPSFYYGESTNPNSFSVPYGMDMIRYDTALNDPDCTVTYPAQYDSGKWYALINGKFVQVVDCCPTEQPTVTNGCCEANQKNIEILTNAVTRLTELVQRGNSGEKTPAVDLTNITNEITTLRMLVDSLRKNQTTIKEVDLSPLQKQINELQRSTHTTTNSVYDDSGLKYQIAELRNLITQTKADSERAPNDELELIKKNYKDIMDAYEQNLAYLQQEMQNGNDPNVQRDYDALVKEKQQQKRAYASHIEKLQNYAPPPRREYTDEDCPDCPAMVETHTRKIFKYPPQVAQQPCNYC